ncbi:MAG: universal stress protein [Planctomycetota bacterium]|nr:universal stress protein [Planctomycetota bacterium]
MQGFQNILVPVDFSEDSANVLETALSVLAADGTLSLLHVVEYLPAVTEGTFGIYPHRKDIESIKKLSLERLKQFAEGRGPSKLEMLVREGKPAYAILDVIRELNPDLVVMGTHGRSKLDHFLIGSVTERVIRKATCSVLTVRT